MVQNHEGFDKSLGGACGQPPRALESVTLKYSTMSQCLSALLGRPARAKFILDGFRWKKKDLTLLYDHCLVTQHPQMQLTQQGLEEEIKATLGEGGRGLIPLKGKKKKTEGERPAPERSRVQVPPWRTM